MTKMTHFKQDFFRIRILLVIATLLAIACHGAKAHAAQCGATLAANPSQATIQSALNACGDGNYVQGVAGTTTISTSGSLTIPCGVMLVGPTANPATMKLTIAGGSENDLTYMSGNCSSSNPTGLSYVDLDTGTGLEVDGSNHSNVTITHSQFTNLSSGSSGASGAVQFDQGNGNTINGFTFEYNTVGDTNSCVNSSTNETSGGSDGCGIEIFSESTPVSHMVNLVIKYNHFTHTNEASHFYGSNFASGNADNTCDNCDIEYNLFEYNHRITLEYQMQTINHPLIISNNVFMTPWNGYFNTYLVSTPCCQYGSTFGSSTISPSYLAQNNVMVVGTTGAAGDTAEWGWEFWGNGTQGTNNLIQGQICAGFQPGHSVNMTIGYNTLQGPEMANDTCTTYSTGGGAYIASVENANQGATPPSNVVGNVESATTHSVTSVTPTISPAGGNVTFPLTVTLTDPGYTSETGNPYPLGNTGIWYTTDGSTPVPGVGTARYIASGGTFSLPAAATVKAVGMWGTPPQPTSYASGFGFTPSAPVFATYSGSGGGGSGTVTLQTLTLTPTASIVAGTPSATQMVSTGNYSDGSTGVVTSSTMFSTSSSSSICTVTGGGAVTAVGAGTCVVSGNDGSATGSVSLSITAPTVTAQYLGTSPTANVNSLVVAQTIQMQLITYYSNGTDAITAASSWAVQTGGSNCSINSSGLLTALAVGSCTVQANGNSSGWDFTITASKTLSNITLSGSATALPVSATLALTATGVYSDSSTAAITPTTWTSSNISSCTVSTAGVVTGVAAGSCTVTATLDSTTSSPGYTIMVTASTPTLVSLAISPGLVLAQSGFQLSAIGTNSAGIATTLDPTTVTWVSSNMNVLDISTAGLAIPIGVGTSLVSASIVSNGTTITSPQVLVLSPTVLTSNITSTGVVPYSWAETCPITQGLGFNANYTLTIGAHGEETITKN